MIPWIDEQHPDFPDPETACEEPDGLLAAGGDLSPQRLITAYALGIFPWYSDGQPILWWSPNPRCVIRPQDVHISRSLKKHIRRASLRLSFDECFDDVIYQCARYGSEEGTWITDEMREAYCRLHNLNLAHSVEVWQGEELVGGLYGIAIGRCFFGESMFSRATNASKVAFAALCRQLGRWRYELIDCQIENPHLRSLGASTIPRREFLSILEQNRQHSCLEHPWRFGEDILSSI